MTLTKDHETHNVCNERLAREGGKATCCDCDPHEGCTLCDRVPDPSKTIKDTLKETWADRFDTKFTLPNKEIGGYTAGSGYIPARLRPRESMNIFVKPDEIKAFIAQELELARREGARSVIGRQPMRYNKSTLVTNQFIASCKNGERPIFESMDYVAISRKQWDEINKRIATLREEKEGEK